jgi:NTP pyrophosphatase (non-canonical NTP hydrolase)
MDTLDELRNANYLRNLEWDSDNKLDMSFFGNELGGECGEAQNIVKKLERERLGIRGSRATPMDLMKELADVVIVADLLSQRVGGDLGRAIREKFNETSNKNGLSIFMRVD